MKNVVLMYIALVVVLSVLSALPVMAHHGGSNFDVKNPVTLKGIVKQFYWANPHTEVFLDVSDEKGNVVTWTLESLSPSTMTRAGWNRTILKPGDKVTIVAAPSKRGTHAGAIRGVTLADGTKLSQGRLGELPVEEGEGQEKY
jgi:hypothetical protein